MKMIRCLYLLIGHCALVLHAPAFASGNVESCRLPETSPIQVHRSRVFYVSDPARAASILGTKGFMQINSKMASELLGRRDRISASSIVEAEVVARTERVRELHEQAERLPSESSRRVSAQLEEKEKELIKCAIASEMKTYLIRIGNFASDQFDMIYRQGRLRIVMGVLGTVPSKANNDSRYIVLFLEHDLQDVATEVVGAE